MPAARVNEVRDAIAAKINAAWIDQVTAVTTPPTAGQRARESNQDEVVTRSRWEIKASKHEGRKIYVYREMVAERPGTRGDDEKDFTFTLTVAERYPGSDDPSEEWIDERIEFCEWLLNLLANARDERLLIVPGDLTSGLWPQEGEIRVLMDEDELDDRKLFVSVLVVMYREQTESPPEE